MKSSPSNPTPDRFLPTLARYPLSVAIGVFIITGLISGLLAWGAEQFREQQARQQVAEIATERAHSIRQGIERALTATYALAALVRQGNGNLPDFEATAQQMLPFYPGVASLQLAPGGIVRRIVPLAGNEKAIGHDLLQDPVRNKEVFLARDTGQLTLAGPFELVQGGLGAAGRLPVYLGEGDTRIFWGFTTVLIRFPEVLNEVRLEHLKALGYAYELWRTHPDSGERQIIAGSGNQLTSPVDKSLELPNGRWTLSMEPMKGWGDPQGVAAKAALCLLFSVLLAYLAKLQVESQRHREVLETQVAQRTLDLSTSEKRIRNMSEAAGAYLWEINTDMVYTYVSGPSAEVKGYPPEALLGHTPMEFMPEEDIAPVAEIVNRAIADKSTFRLQHRDITPNGDVCWEEVFGAIFCDAEGKVIGLRGTGMDINVRKSVEAELIAAKQDAEKANLAKSRFLAAASHDLRQPLSALTLFVSVLKKTVPASCNAVVSKIGICIESLSELLTDLLDISKLDARVVTPKVFDFSVDDLLSSLVSTQLGDAEIKGLRLRGRRCSVFTRTDPLLLRRILANLLSNAIRYTNQGGVLIACRRTQGKQWIEVWDTGIGIPAESTKVIFEEFKQIGDESRSRGSGLGLAIVAKTAALLELEIRLKSRPGRGSMFAVELPAGRASATETSPNTLPATRALKIALVDDNSHVLQAFALALECHGHHLIAAQSGAELLEKLGEHGPDMVISDYRLARSETGFDVIKRLRDTFGDTLPALIVTGDTDPALVRSMADRGITVLYKPLQMDALQTFIRDSIERQSP